MQRLFAHYDRLTAFLAGRWSEGLALLAVRLALAGIFWRSGRSKVVEGTWLTISDSTYYLFENDYAAVPLPPALAAQLATWSEHLFPMLLVAGLFTRLSAAALLGMTLVIQVFVFPEAWWTTHLVWAALAVVLIARGSGLFGLDPWLARRVGRSNPR
jgi:putative oxidoreductase